jgi:hypothetical protein
MSEELLAEEWRAKGVWGVGLPEKEKKTIDYKFNEDKLVKELLEYINKTYKGHYSKNKFQSTEFIIDCGHGIGFSSGSITKYNQRYGKKGEPPDWRQDILKILHYGIIMLYNHDLEHGEHV